MSEAIEAFISKVFKEALSGPRIFKNKNVLFHDYIPDNLPFRENEIRKIAYLLSNLLKGYRSSNLFIYGKPGTGKTAVVKYTLKKLLSIANEHGKKINVTYVNCRLAGTEYRVVASMALDVGVSLPFTGLSVEEALSRFINKVTSDQLPLLIVLDEIDSLIIRYGDKLLYTLTRFSNDTNNAIPYMIIGISNNLTFKEYMDPRVLSSLSEDEIVFKPYKPEELEKIIEDRTSLAFYPGVVDKDVIKLVASLAGAEHGDARKALDLIRMAGEIAESENYEKILVEHVHKAYSTLDRERLIEAISTLPLHSRLILLSLYKLLKNNNGTVKSSYLYTVYQRYAENITKGVLSYRRFLGLLSELNVLGIIDRKLENYGRRGGRVSLVRVSIPIEYLERVLREDPIIGELFNVGP